jgi:hypothetical protein
MDTRRTLVGIALLAASSACVAQTTVRIKGQVHAPEHERVTITLLDAAGDTLAQHHRPGGHFNFRAPAGKAYRVRFAQPYSLTKEVVVDTRNAHRSPGQYKVRRVGFDVVMEPGDPHVHLQYAGPVGSMAFRENDGRLIVERHYALEPASEPLAMPQ